jgi:Glycosyltransferase 61
MNVNFPFERMPPPQRKKPAMLTCFDDVYLSVRNGIWMSKNYNFMDFRAKSAQLFAEPAAALNRDTGEHLEEAKTTRPLRSKPAFCQSYKPRDTSAQKPVLEEQKTATRIAVFQRTGTAMLRSFINLAEVVDLAQSYTSLPVKVMTVNGSTPFRAQIRLFNTFDVLISPHGSHLANGIFTMNPNSKVDTLHDFPFCPSTHR